mgnify:FL=1
MMRKKKKTNIIKNQKIADALMDLSALDDEEYAIKKAMAIKKMQGFLLEKGYADTFQNIKKLPRITIKGLDANGYERLIAKELRKRVGESDIELSNGFNTIYPLLKTGVICYKTANGTHYTHYRTTDVSEQTFGITIHEYVLEQGIFYLSSEVKIKEMSKKLPYYISTHSIQPVCNMIFGENREAANRYFSTQEKVLIAQNLELSENAAIEEMDVIIWNTVAYFKSINYLWEIFKTKELDISGIFSDSNETFINNAFFSIDNIGTSINFDDRSSNKIISDERNEFIEEIIQSENDLRILKKNTIGKIINEIAKRENITTFYVAVGFAFRSGLMMIEDIFNLIYTSHGKCQMIVGALQNYGSGLLDYKINKDTAKYLNALIDTDKIELFTNQHVFYHGKFYYLSNQEKAYIITGSSNLSATAFNKNYEMDVIQVVKKGSKQDLAFLKWYEELRTDCIELQHLDENKFEEFGWNSELDVFSNVGHSDVKNGRISVKAVLEKLKELSDEETQFRIKLWMKYNPAIYDKDFIEIESLKGYSMFVFEENKLVVFESFEPRNSYYTFRCPHGVENLIKEIKSMSKTDMRMSENFVVRGNHTKNRENLIARIDRVFQ